MTDPIFAPKADDSIPSLREKYPHLFTNVRCGMDVGKGWIHILDALAYAITECLTRNNCDLNSVKVQQVKEKFGGLRFYYSLNTDNEEVETTIRVAVEIAEIAASLVCEQCGAPGTLRTNSWMTVACDLHAK